MDLKDKKILYELDLNGRADYSEIAKKVGLSKETTRNRIKSLEHEGIIQGYNALINIAKLGYTQYTIYSRLENVTKNIKDELINFLKQKNEVFWVAMLGGNYDLVFGIQAKNITDFTRIYADIQNKFHKYLRDSSISTRSRLYQFPRDYLCENKTHKSPKIGSDFKLVEIDEIDRKIINSISENGRMTSVDLSKELKIPRTTIIDRLRIIEKERIIEGYGALIHAEKFGYQIFQLLINIDPIEEKEILRMQEYCSKNNHINFFIYAVGKWDVELSCEIENHEKLQELLTELRSEFESIKRIEIVLTFNVYVKYRLFA